MAEYLPKQKRGVYEKNSQLSHVLRNLHGYKVATGDVDPAQLSQAQQLYGEDEGRVLGALITGVPEKPRGDGEVQNQSKSHRRRRRKRRGNRKQTEPIQQCQTTQTLVESLPKKLKPTTKPSSSLSMLSVYSDSSDSDVGQTLEVPSAIQDMFTEDPIELTESIRGWSRPSPRTSGGTNTLSYFEASGSDGDSDTDVAQTDLSKRDVERCEPPPPSLSTYLCWKCSKVGHLAQDCTVVVSAKRHSGRSKVKISSELQAHYARCREIRSKTGARCIECGIHSNLACCLECGAVLCDGRGHLSTHLLNHPSHRMLYSYKLQRMLKCCKASCESVDIYNLLMCSVCLGKAYSQHYSMITATWSRSGLMVVPNALCCEEHFQWHRMNCSDTAEELFVSTDSLTLKTGQNETLSEFFF